MRWLSISIIVMYSLSCEDEVNFNPINLIRVLSEKGIQAWIELFIITGLIILIGSSLTKLTKWIAGRLSIKISFWLSYLFSICFTVFGYYLIMAILQPIKNV